MKKFLGWLAVVAMGVATGCNSGSDTPPATTYTVGGTVTGLTGTGLVLRNNGGDPLAVSASGSFAFTTGLADGTAYAVTVAAQPTGQTCTVTNGTGTIASANVTNVAVACVAGSYTVGGTVSGLSGSGLVLKNNGGDDLAVNASGAFVFATPVAAGTAYAVTVAVQPSSPTQSCVVTNGTGNGTSGNVTNVTVTCTTSSFTIGGTVTGLTGAGLQLLDKGGDALPVNANGAFTFVTPIASGDSYLVTVGTQPTGQVCSVASGTGIVGGASVTNVAVTCSTSTYNVGGTVAGLSGTGLVLRNNGGDPLVLNANGGFTFSAPVANGSAYAVTVAVQPSSPAQTCTVSNGTGIISGANVTDVAVACTTPTYTIGGTVTGLTGAGLVLQDNAGDDLSIGASGAFTFTTALTTGSAYAVTVRTQPSGPTQSCVVTGGTGTVPSANVTNVSVTCTTSTFTVGGTVTGLSGTGLVLRNNGGDDLVRNATGAFTFATPVASGAAYGVTVFTQPTSPYQVCTVTNGSGTVGATDVTNVSVGCVTPPQVVQSWTAPTSWGGTATGFWADGETGMVQHLTFPGGTPHESGAVVWDAPNGAPPIQSLDGVGNLGVTRYAAGPFNVAAGLLGHAYVATSGDGALDETGDLLVCAVVKPTWNLPFTDFGANDNVIIGKGFRGQNGWALMQALHYFSFRYQLDRASDAERVAFTSTDLVPEDGSYRGPLNPSYVVVCAGRDVAGGAIRVVANGWNSSMDTAVDPADRMLASAQAASLGGYAANGVDHDYGGRIYETAVWQLPASRANIEAKMAPVMGLSMPSGTATAQYTRDREGYYPGAVVSPAPYHTAWKHQPRIDPTGKGILFGLQGTNRVTIPEALQDWTPSVAPAPTVVANNDFPPGDARVENAALVTLPALSSISVPVTTFGNPGAVHGQIWLKSTDEAQRGTLTVRYSPATGTPTTQDIALPTLASEWNHYPLTQLSTPAAASGALELVNNGAGTIQFEAWGVVATQIGAPAAGGPDTVPALGFDPGPTIYSSLFNPSYGTPREVLALPVVAQSTAGTGFCIGAQGQPAAGSSWEGSYLERRTMVEWYGSATSYAKVMVTGGTGSHVFRFRVANGGPPVDLDAAIPGGLSNPSWVKGCVGTDGTMRLYVLDVQIATRTSSLTVPELDGGTLYVGSDDTGTEPWHGYIQGAATCRDNGLVADCH